MGPTCVIVRSHPNFRNELAPGARRALLRKSYRSYNNVAAPSLILSGAPFFDHSRTKLGTCRALVTCFSRGSAEHQPAALKPGSAGVGSGSTNGSPTSRVAQSARTSTSRPLPDAPAPTSSGRSARPRPANAGIEREGDGVEGQLTFGPDFQFPSILREWPGPKPARCRQAKSDALVLCEVVWRYRFAALLK